MAQLRPHHGDSQEFVATVRRMMGDGYRLALLETGGVVAAVGGFRIFEMLYRGRFLYVDDLVTDGAKRSRGHGATLLDWLRAYARAEGCRQLVLDSGVQRSDAHRFYFRQGMRIDAYNFNTELD